MKDTDSRNNPKQVDCVHVRVKKSKHHSYKKKRSEENHGNFKLKKRSKKSRD